MAKQDILREIHRDLMTVTAAVSNTSYSVKNGYTIKSSIADSHTEEVAEASARLQAAVDGNADLLGAELAKKIQTVVTVAGAQAGYYRRALIMVAGGTISSLVEGGMFQELIALRKAAKVEAQEGAPALVVGQEVVLSSGVMGAIQEVGSDGEIKVRLICDSGSVAVPADKVAPIIRKDGGYVAAARDALLVLTRNGIGDDYEARVMGMSYDEVSSLTAKVRAEALCALAHYHHSGSHAVRMMRGAVVSFTYNQENKAEAAKFMLSLRALLISQAGAV